MNDSRLFAFTMQFNRFYLIVCDVINYTDVISEADWYESAKNVGYVSLTYGL